MLSSNHKFFYFLVYLGSSRITVSRRILFHFMMIFIIFVETQNSWGKFQSLIIQNEENKILICHLYINISDIFMTHDSKVKESKREQTENKKRIFPIFRWQWSHLVSLVIRHWRLTYAMAKLIIRHRRKRKAREERERNGEFTPQRSVPALDTNNLSITRPGD